jgi:hypothetical protein
MIKSIRVIAGAVAAGALIAGCSGGPKGPPTAAADGTVMSKGSPMAGVTVTFLSEKGSLAIGETDAQGKFRLSAVAVGPAKVTIVKPVDSGSSSMTITTPPKNQAESELYLQQKREMMRARAEASQAPSIPAKYSKRETTPLDFTIKADGDNHFTIDL